MKVAIPTDDGIRIAARFGRTSVFLVAEVGLGAVERLESRANPGRERPGVGRTHRDRHRLLSDVLSDCRVVIASSMGEPMRRALTRRGLEVVITSEELVDRVLALFALASLKDESRMDPDDESGLDPVDDTGGEPPRADEFDA